MTDETLPPTTVLDLVVFLDELVLLVVLAVAGAGVGGPLAVRVAAAIALPAAAAVVWGRWLAPRAGARLAYPVRLVAKLAIFAIAAVLVAIAGWPVLAAAFLAISAVILVAGEVTDHRRST